MEIKQDLLIGISASILAALALTTVRYLLTRRFRDICIRYTLRLLGAGVEFVYPNWEAAKKDILTELSHANCVIILNLRGRSLVERDFRFLLTSIRPVKVLLADPDAPAEYNPVELRARELHNTGSKLSPAVHVNEAKSVLGAFYGYNQNEKCRLKVYQFPAVFRVFATDRLMFLSFYPSNEGVSNSKIFRIPMESPLFHMIYKYFDCTWNDVRSREPLHYRLYSGERTPA